MSHDVEFHTNNETLLFSVDKVLILPFAFPLPWKLVKCIVSQLL